MKETKEMISLITASIKSIDDALADGKLSLLDLFKLKDVMPKLGPAIDNASMIDDELKGMNEQKRRELVEFIRQEFDISNDFIEEIAEHVIDIVSGFLLAIKKYRESRN